MGRNAAGGILLADPRIALSQGLIVDRNGPVYTEGEMGATTSTTRKAVRSVRLSPGTSIDVGPYRLTAIPAPAGYSGAITGELTRPAENVATEFLTRARRLTLASLGLPKRGMALALFALVAVAFLLVPAGRVLGLPWSQPEAFAMASDRFWNPGPVMLAHQPVEQKCESCHQEPFRQVRDSACLECHRGIGHHVAQDLKPAALFAGSRCAAWVLTTQPQEFAPLARMALPLGRPSLILTASKSDQQELAGMGCTAQFIPLGVDLERFVPATPSGKTELRAKYGIGREQFVALHVGHLSKGRNIKALEQVQDGGSQVLIAVSTFFAHDSSLMGHLEARGVRFATQYSDHIEELDQLADCYLFPVLTQRACISQPLSVLEAMACNLPIVTTRFGGLPDLFPEEGTGLLYVDGPSQMPAKVAYLRQAFRSARPGTRARP